MKEARITAAMFWIYNLLFCACFLLALPYLAWKVASEPKYRVGFFRRLGFYPPTCRTEGARPIWFHGVSVGEILAMVPFVEGIRRSAPDLPFVVSSITIAGRRTAERVFGRTGRVTWFPFDHPVAVRRALRVIRPRLFIHTETEIWPNFLLMLARRGIPSAIVNGRISARSCARFARFRFFLKRVLAGVVVFGMQSQTDCERIIRIGADPRRVFRTGNMKFDVPLPARTVDGRRAFREAVGVGEQDLLFVAGSTHRGEEEILLEAYAALRRRVPGLRVLLAPRHPERCGEVQRICDRMGLRWRRRTDRSPVEGNEGAEVLLLDTMGELIHAYGAADLVFLGGTLVPIGGHNPLEAAHHRKCVLLGPYTEKIAETVRALLEVGGGFRVTGREDLERVAERLLLDPGAREAAGEAAQGILAANRGAVERNLALLGPFLYRDGEGPGRDDEGTPC